ncbi:MAG: cupredoxin domain-containing protein [Nitrospiria bacterium]
MIFRNWMILLAQLFLFLLSPVHVEGAEAAEVAVQLKEFRVEAVPQTIKTGKIRFVAVNQGSEEHELVVRKKENGGFKELGEIEPFPPGTTKEMTLTLSPGIYELSCQIVEKEEGETVDHYKRGMRVGIEVN